MPDKDMTAEDFCISAFYSFLDDAANDTERGRKAKQIVEYYREARGKKNAGMDSMLLAFVGGFIIGGEMADYLHEKTAV